MIPPKCIKETRDPRIVLKEKRCKVTFLNSDTLLVQKVTVDGCAITEGKRCDYLLIAESKNEYYVELKATARDHAITQIKNSIQILTNRSLSGQILAYIVCLQNPMVGTKTQSQMLKLKKEHKCSLSFIKTNSEADLQ